MSDRTCRQVRNLIQACVDGAATGAERARVDAHLRECPTCAHMMEESRQLVTLLSGMPHRRVSEGFEHDLMTALQHTAPVSHSAAWWERFRLRFDWRLRVPTMVAAGSLAAALVAVAVAPLAVSQREKSADARGYLASAVERHRQLERSSPGVDWDAVDASIQLSTGDVLTE
jgi:anti-sigma factor RsiW